MGLHSHTAIYQGGRKERSLPQAFLYQLWVLPYRFEVTMGLYVMTPGEKLVAYLFVLTLAAGMGYLSFRLIEITLFSLSHALGSMSLDWPIVEKLLAVPRHTLSSPLKTVESALQTVEGSMDVIGMAGAAMARNASAAASP